MKVLRSIKETLPSNITAVPKSFQDNLNRLGSLENLFYVLGQWTDYDHYARHSDQHPVFAAHKVDASMFNFLRSNIKRFGPNVDATDFHWFKEVHAYYLGPRDYGIIAFGIFGLLSSFLRYSSNYFIK